MNEKDFNEKDFLEKFKKLGIEGGISFNKAMTKYAMDKLGLISDTLTFFNTWLSESFYIIHTIKPTKEYIKEALNNYMVQISEIFNEVDDNIINELLNVISNKSEQFTEEPFVNLLYLKFSIIYGVIADMGEMPFIPLGDKKILKDSLFTNITRTVEVIDLFVDDWTPDMEASDIKNLIGKLTDKLNRKYNKKEYELYS